MNHKAYFGALLGNQRGVALLITISIITVLLAVTFDLNRRVRMNVSGTAIDKTEHGLLQVAESGISIGKAVLVKDASETNTSSVQEKWAQAEALEEIIRSVGFESGKPRVTITDETGKIQVNALIREYPGNNVNVEQKKIWENLLSFFISSNKSEDDRDPSQIINCLIDWLDARDNDAITGVSGAESVYYESLETPYRCANRDMYHLNELFRIKGVSRDLLTRSESLVTPFSDQEEKENPIHVNDLFTAFGAEKVGAGKNENREKYRYSGNININTAPLPVIAALLPFGKQDLAERISEYRTARPDKESSYTNDLSVKGWWARVAGLSDTEQDRISRMVTYKSRIFTIESYAELEDRSLVLKSVVERQKDKNGKWICKTLRQEIE